MSVADPPAATGCLAAIDAGQTAMKVRVRRADGAPTDHSLPGVRTHEDLLPQLAEATRAIRRISAGDIHTLTAGVSGLTSRDSDAAALLALVGDTGVRRVVLTHDSVTSFLGTLGDTTGAVVAAGTGVVTLAVGEASVARVDGWGNIMGDAGSGYWIGREALDVAMRAYDGREAPTALTDMMRERWPSLEDAYIDLQSDPHRVQVVAGFARPVADLAETDAAAARICVRAARELATSAHTALRRVAQDDPARPTMVAAIGGVFRARRIRERFEELLREARRGVRFESPHGTGLDGATALADLPAGHPLGRLISVAEA